MTDEFEEILTPGALEFVAKLARNFTDRRDTLLHNRKRRQKELDAGEKLDFLKETEEIRNSSGRSTPFLMTCGIGGWKSPAPLPTGRW